MTPGADRARRRLSGERSPSPTLGEERYAHVVQLLEKLLRLVYELAQHVDEIDSGTAALWRRLARETPGRRGVIDDDMFDGGQAAGTVREFAPQRVPDSWRLLDDAELMELPDPEFIIADILPRHGIGVLYGPSGAAKTTLIADDLADAEHAGTVDPSVRAEVRRRLEASCDALLERLRYRLLMAPYVSDCSSRSVN